MKSDLSNFSRQELEAALSVGGIRTNSGCLLWLGSRRPTGYGTTRAKGVVLGANRVACFLAHGAPAAGQDACHTCDTPPCIEQDHLFWGSRSDNMIDAARKRRLWQMNRPQDLVRGHAHPRAILSDAVLREIVLTDTPAIEIERKHGYARQNVSAIRHGRLWREEVAAIRSLSVK